MSQAGIASITKSSPSIPTSFNGDSGTAVPVGNVLNVLGASANFVTGSGNTLTASWFNWQTVPGTSQAISNRNAYICTNSSKTTFTLPTTAAIGDSFLITCDSTATSSPPWQINQNANQQIQCGRAATSVGVGGSLTTVAANKCTVIISCVRANTIFAITSCDVINDLAFS